jgi:hypothetical protein
VYLTGRNPKATNGKITLPKFVQCTKTGTNEETMALVIDNPKHSKEGFGQWGLKKHQIQK